MKILLLALSLTSIQALAHGLTRAYLAHSIGLNTQEPVRFQLTQKIRADICNSYMVHSDEFIKSGAQPSSLRYISDAEVSKTEMDCGSDEVRIIKVKTRILKVQPLNGHVDFTLYAPKEWTLKILR